MNRVIQLCLFLVLGLSAWYAMMAVHELGHALGAYLTGGSVTKVVLHPLSISRTDVDPNPHPSIVVWAGPVVGSLLPLAISIVIPRRLLVASNLSRFFAGFCLVTNGAYIGAGVWDQVGDCREMLRTGTPLWGMLLFGGIAISLGLLVWHRLGSIGSLLRDPSMVRGRWVGYLLVVLVVYLAMAAVLSPRI